MKTETAKNVVGSFLANRNSDKMSVKSYIVKYVAEFVVTAVFNAVVEKIVNFAFIEDSIIIKNSQQIVDQIYYKLVDYAKLLIINLCKKRNIDIENELSLHVPRYKTIKDHFHSVLEIIYERTNENNTTEQKTKNNK